MAAGVTPGGHLFYPSRMARYAAVRALSPTEAAYVAGIVDGEGTITLTTMHAGENRRLVVSVSSTERFRQLFSRLAEAAFFPSNNSAEHEAPTPFLCRQLSAAQPLHH
jgi:hypothetical protein